MTRNLGNIERIIRVVVGFLVLAVGVFGDLPLWGTVVASVFGVIALLTGAIGFCPAWKLFGINTCPVSGSTSAHS